MTRVFDEDLTSGFGTRAMHAGQRPEPLAGAIMTPVYLTSTYVQEELGRNKGYEYARGKNPTRRGARAKRRRAGGGAARVRLLQRNGMRRLPDEAVPGRAITSSVGKTSTEALSASSTRSCSTSGWSSPSWTRGTRSGSTDAMTRKTRAVLVETPSNPLMRVTDLKAAADIAHRHRALLIVDNTFASPLFQRPFEFGADIVFHSTTKYLNGHSDMIGGIAIAQRRRSRGTAAVHPERRRRHSGPLRLLAGASRHQDAPPAHAPARHQRPRDRALARGRARRGVRDVRRAAKPSATRARQDDRCPGSAA